MVVIWSAVSLDFHFRCLGILSKIRLSVANQNVAWWTGCDDEEKKKLGAASAEEKLVFFIFSLAALSWITRSFLLEKIFPGISDGAIAMTFAILLFIIP